MKRCYSCKLVLPLFLFSRSTRAILKTDFKRLRVCRICNFIKSKNKVVRCIDRKYVLVNLTIRQRINELFK